MKRMFTRFYIFLLTGSIVAWLSLTSVEAGAQRNLFGNGIHHSAEAGKIVVQAAEDLAYWLERAGHARLPITSGISPRGNGISLQLAGGRGTDVSNRIRNEISKSGQAFHLSVNEGRVVITGTSDNSLVNGVYTFLHELGFRWYMPGEIWTIVPKNLKLQKTDRFYSPDFTNRFYFGSGGMTPIPGVDPKDEFSSSFLQWNMRNRISSDYANKGHAGLAFYTSMKAELDKHPEYFCEGKVDKNGRINLDNKGAVDIFVKWALSQVKPGTRFPVIGVDPADGSGAKGDCLPTTIPEIKTYGDKYFWLANQVAKNLSPADNTTRVVLYAYNQHAAVPAFDLHKNVFPVIIPYAFQDVAQPEEYIRDWSKKLKGRDMGIYDYWNITQWGKSLPDFNIYSVPQKLKLWKDNSIKTINLESTYSKGAMGHVFWVATQMMWDADQSFEDLFNEFLTNSFGDAAPYIRKMYDRWSLRYQGVMEPTFSRKDISDAEKVTRDPLVLARLKELKAYIQYVELYYAYTANPTVANYEQLMNYMLSVHHLGLVHTSALEKYYIPKPKGYVEIKDKKQIEARNARIKKADNRDIDKTFRKAIEASSQPYSISSLRFSPSKAEWVQPKGKIYNPTFINNTNNYQFYLDRQRKLKFSAGAGKDTRFLITGANGKIFFDKVMNGGKGTYEDINVTLPKGDYTLTFGEVARSGRVIFPEGISFFSRDHNYDNAGYPRLYIYVPADVDEIVYNDQLGPGINDRGFWWDPDGKKIHAQKISNGIYKVPVPSSQRGKVWTLDIGHRKFEMLNIPSIFSLNPFRYVE